MGEREVTIVIADPTRPAYATAALEALAEAGWRVEIAPGFDDDDLLPLAPRCDALVTRRRAIPDAFLATAPRLRCVQHLGSRPHANVAAWAARRGVPLELTPTRGSIAVAEHAMALLLALTRGVIAGHDGTRTGAYRARGLTPQPTSEVEIAFQWLDLPGIRLLHGTTMGIVGFGEIGQALSRMARGFGMVVLYHRRNPLAPELERELGVAFAELDVLLAAADVVSLHLPHTRETERLLDERRLRTMRKGAYLINVARGGIVDEEALVRVLCDGHLSGAGLDVFALEPLPDDHPLLGLDNVCLTPHVGSAPARGLGEMMTAIKPKLLRALGGA